MNKNWKWILSIAGIIAILAVCGIMLNQDSEPMTNPNIPETANAHDAMVWQYCNEVLYEEELSDISVTLVLGISEDTSELTLNRTYALQVVALTRKGVEEAAATGKVDRQHMLDLRAACTNFKKIY